MPAGMDSKSEPSSSLNNEDAAAPPPSYNESNLTGTSVSRSDEKQASRSDGNAPQLYSSQIQQQLSSLATTIATLQTQRVLLSHAQDQKVLSTLTSHVQVYLSEFAKSGLTKGTLILVPQAGLKDDNAVPHEFLDGADQYNRVVRLGDSDDEHLIAYQRAREEFGYGYEEERETGDLWFWRDEAMAERLATYLRPPRPEPRPAIQRPLPPRQEVIVVPPPPAKASSGFLKTIWGRKKEAPPPPPVIVEVPRVDIKREVPEEPAEDKVVMDVKGEEVYFRTENDFGILGSKTGYCIVMRLRVELARDRR